MGVKMNVNFGPQMGTFPMPWFCGYDIGIPGCDATYEQTVLSSTDDLGRIFGTKPETCKAVTGNEPVTPSDDETSTDEDPNSAAGTNHFGIAAVSLLLIPHLLA